MIYLVRHGEAAASWGAHPDPGLSEKGQAQAEAVADTLMDLGAKALISSPMQRCRETAAPFARKLGQGVAIEPAVSEIITPEGIDDRVTWLRELMAGDWPETMSPWRENALDMIEGLHDGTVVFSHFVAINAIVGLVQKTPRVLVFKPDHCSVTKLERDADGTLKIARLGGDATTQIL